jgi:F-type H+-transporting ATPase subunit b
MNLFLIKKPNYKTRSAFLAGVGFICVAILFSCPVMAQSVTDSQAPSVHQELQEELKDDLDFLSPHDLISEENTTDTTHISDPHEKKGGMPQLDSSTFASQIFWLLFFFVTLYAYFGKIILPRLSSTLDDRHRQIYQKLAEAEKLKMTSDETLTGFEGTLKAARTNATALLEEASNRARSDMNKAANDYRARFEQAVHDAHAELKQKNADITANLNQTAASVASQIITKLSSPIAGAASSDILTKIAAENATKH